MKRLSHLMAALLLLVGFGCATTDTATKSSTAARGGIPASWTDIQPPPLRSFDIQQPKRIELDNGLVIFLQEDHELPLTRGMLFVRGGSRDEPEAKRGLTAIYGQAWRTGGTESRTGDELDEFLEARAATVETSADDDTTSISWDSLEGDFDDVFPIVVDLLKHPAFREDKIDLAKKQMNTGIARRNDNPQGIAGREAAKLVYGELSPYARVPEYDTVDAVTRDDLVAWHEATAHPNNMIIGVTGDFDSAKMEAAIREAFGSMPKGPAVTTPKIELQMADPGIYLVEKDDVTQSNIRVVQPGVMRNNPDYFAIRVMNEIFGGGFSARLFSSIRSDQGLAYSVGGGIGSSYDHPGMFMISMGTKSESTLKAINALHAEIDKLQAGPITEAELERAQESLLNSFIFNVDSKEEILREKMVLEFYGYPLDFLDRFQASIGNVTTEEVQRVAREYIDRDNLAVLVVGKPSDFDGDLSEIAKVTKIDISIPEPGASKKAALASNEAGRELMKLAIKGLGGEKAVDAVKAVMRSGDVVANTPQGEMAIGIESLEVYPSSIRQTMKTPMGQMTMVATSDEAFMMMGTQSRPLPGSQKAELLKSLMKSPISIAQNRDKEGYVFSAGGMETIEGTEASVLDIDADGVRVRWYLDPKSGNIIRTESSGTNMAGAPVTEVTNYSNFKKVEGLVQPFEAVVMQNGEKSATVTLTEIDVNPKVSDDAFAKPE